MNTNEKFFKIVMAILLRKMLEFNNFNSYNLFEFRLY